MGIDDVQEVGEQQAKDEFTRLGTHTLRKTGYLFAIWGSMKPTDGTSGASEISEPLSNTILTCARHKSGKHAKTYMGDAATIMNMVIRANVYFEHRLSKWHANIVQVPSSSTA